MRLGARDLRLLLRDLLSNGGALTVDDSGFISDALAVLIAALSIHSPARGRDKRRLGLGGGLSLLPLTLGNGPRFGELRVSILIEEREIICGLLLGKSGPQPVLLRLDVLLIAIPASPARFAVDCLAIVRSRSRIRCRAERSCASTLGNR